MTESLEPIVPSEYIAEWSPTAEADIEVADWFETEFLDIKSGGLSTPISYDLAGNVTAYENETNPTAYTSNENKVKEEDLHWFYAQGWVLYETIVDVESVTQTFVSGLPDNTLSWPYTIYRLKRRKLQSERVLQDLVSDFTSAYNEGREINDRRYDEIVAISEVMLSRSEEEVNYYNDQIAPFYDALINNVISGLSADSAAYAVRLNALLDDFGVSGRERINLRFDNQLAEARQDLVTRGMYNTTVWTTTASGIERNREYALNEFEDKLTERTMNGVDRIQQVSQHMHSGIEAASVRMLELKKSRRFDSTELRNRILTAQLAFMERRQDEYPGRGELVNIAAQLGFAEGGTVAPPSTT